MTVKELIEKLQKCDPESFVWIVDLDWNLYPIDNVKQNLDNEVEIQYC